MDGTRHRDRCVPNTVLVQRRTLRLGSGAGTGRAAHRGDQPSRCAGGGTWVADPCAVEGGHRMKTMTSLLALGALSFAMVATSVARAENPAPDSYAPDNTGRNV